MVRASAMGAARFRIAERLKTSNTIYEEAKACVRAHPSGEGGQGLSNHSGNRQRRRRRFPISERRYPDRTQTPAKVHFPVLVSAQPSISCRTPRSRSCCRVPENYRPPRNCVERPYRRSGASPNRQSVSHAKRHSQSPRRLSAFPHSLERRGPRHPDTPSSQSRIQETHRNCIYLRFGIRP
jgi:hypothetical protein